MEFTIQGLTKAYLPGQPVLKNINLTIHEGEKVLILGPSGVGKTTLLRILAGIDQNYEGSVQLEGKDIKELSDKEKQHFRQSVGYMFQEYALLEKETVFDNAAIPLLGQSLSHKERRERVQDLLNLFAMEEMIDRPVNQLSGGQRQRVALIRAILGARSCLIADEPFHAVDKELSRKIMDWLNQHFADKQMILAFHERPEEKMESFQPYWLKKGKLVADAPSEDEE